jgi:hypothetical protein
MRVREGKKLPQIVWQTFQCDRRLSYRASLYDVDVTRRCLLGTAVAGGSGLAAASVLSARAHAASFGNPDEPPQGAVNAKNPASLTDPGPM